MNFLRKSLIVGLGVSVSQFALAVQPIWESVAICEGGKVVIDRDLNDSQSSQLVVYDPGLAQRIERSGSNLFFRYFGETGAHVISAPSDRLRSGPFPGTMEFVWGGSSSAGESFTFSREHKFIFGNCARN